MTTVTLADLKGRVLPQNDYAQSPVIVFWETTRACALACVHCRASAIPQRHPLELSTEEGRTRVIDELASFPQRPILVLSGGDPLMRRDILELARYGVEHGLVVSLSPAATALSNGRNLARVRETGVRHISVSLDGSCPDTHDSFRGVAGSYERARQTVAVAREVGLSVQVNTTVTRRTRQDLPAIAERVAEWGAVMWDVFFLVPTGRANTLVEDVLSPEEHEEVYTWLADLAEGAPYRLKATMGQPFRRVTLLREWRQHGFPQGDIRVPVSTNDGKGVLFVSHVGEVFPSGFLPVCAGNVRTDSLVRVYQESALFRDLRDPSLLKGKCGLCPFNAVCGGCRARAYAMSGDMFAAEPCCPFMPPSA
ncbi:MAG: radical SAM protein [Chloroflexi bacterium]|nr:radical SAM protein [Chloroflexota bacterium]